MKYDLSNELHRAQFRTRTAKLLKDGKAVVELKECRPPRTTRQNSYLHASLAYFASQTGSASLSTEEMSLSLDRFRNWASETAGIYIPSPDDARLVQLMELETERNKTYI